MKILMLGWELPPYNSGGLGIACFQLCKALANKDVDIEFVLPYQAKNEASFMEVIATGQHSADDLLALGTAYNSQDFRQQDFRVGNTGLFEQQAQYELAAVKLAETREFDIVHAHDWLTFRAALRIKES